MPLLMPAVGTYDVLSVASRLPSVSNAGVAEPAAWGVLGNSGGGSRRRGGGRTGSFRIEKKLGAGAGAGGCVARPANRHSVPATLRRLRSPNGRRAEKTYEPCPAVPHRAAVCAAVKQRALLGEEDLLALPPAGSSAMTTTSSSSSSSAVCKAGTEIARRVAEESVPSEMLYFFDLQENRGGGSGGNAAAPACAASAAAAAAGGATVACGQLERIMHHNVPRAEAAAAAAAAAVEAGGDGSVPPLVAQLEGELHERLSALNGKMEEVKARAEGGRCSEEVVNRYLDDRLGVFRSCGRRLAAHFRAYGAVLQAVFAEYERYFRHLKRGRRTAAARRAAAASELKESERRRQAVEGKLGGVDAAIQGETAKMYALAAGGQTLFDLHQEVAELRAQLAESRTEAAGLRGTLAETGRLRVQFDSTLASMEEAFTVTEAQGAIQVEHERRRVREVEDGYLAQIGELRVATTRLEDRAGDLLSQRRVADAQIEVLQNALRQAEGRSRHFAAENAALQDELNEQERRAEVQARLRRSDSVVREGLFQRARETVPTLSETALEEAESLAELVALLLKAWPQQELQAQQSAEEGG